MVYLFRLCQLFEGFYCFHELYKDLLFFIFLLILLLISFSNSCGYFISCQRLLGNLADIHMYTFLLFHFDERNGVFTE